MQNLLQIKQHFYYKFQIYNNFTIRYITITAFQFNPKFK